MKWIIPVILSACLIGCGDTTVNVPEVKPQTINNYTDSNNTSNTTNTTTTTDNSTTGSYNNDTSGK